ncbi:MAG: hypothetical protein N3D15_08920 [Syntrophorhabdaceae bacterium]|nr:hypothetical protein [Syntrophorhabdaceae bacterium]
MKKIIFLSMLTVSYIFTLPAYGADINVNGIWKNNGQTMIFFQERDNIKVMCSYHDGSKIVVWYGEGVIKGNKLEYYLHHANLDKPGSYNHYHAFTVSDDGKKMIGTWGTVSQPVHGHWELRKVGP